MTIAAIIISSVSLLISLVVYCRFSGREAQRFGQSLRRDLTALTAKQKELFESATHSLAVAYEQSRRQLAATRETLRHYKEEAASGVAEHMSLALQQLGQLSAELEENAHVTKINPLVAARRVQAAIADRVRRLEARALLLLAGWKAHSARVAAIEQRFAEAEELLDEASGLIGRADDNLKCDPHFEIMSDGLRRAMREAAASLRAHADLTVRKMDRLLAETERLVRDLERDETRRAGRALAPANGEPRPMEAVQLDRRQA